MHILRLKFGIECSSVTLSVCMKRVFGKLSVCFSAVVMMCSSLVAEEMDKAVAVGDSAPEFELLNQRGEKVSLAQFRGKKPIVLAFSRAHW